MNQDVERKLREMNISFPPITPKAVGNYVPWVISGNMVYTSGQLPWKDGEYGNLAFKGKVGLDVTIEEGYICAKICALNAIAQLKDAVGDLNQIQKIVRIDGHIQAAEGFSAHSDVLDGASDIFNEVFGVKGLHTRSALGISQAPLDAPVLIYVIAEIV
ncbi:RidA family protein [Chryseobacterium sp. OSA05B]|uniref:RidA family protein n=1 Tax=Chryseobacterium sp. OSA05B TaxID=2862650 RepID=UPI001CC038B0|nr:RidA family protein [Chryseobacterium sp. OSA05B]